MKEIRINRRSFLGVAAAAFAPSSLLLPSGTLAQSASQLDEIKKRGSLRVGWAIWVPYMYLDPKSRQRTGITISLAEAISERLGVKAEYVETSWATMVAGIQAGQYNMTMPCSITEERAKAVTFSNPIVNMNWGLVVPKSKLASYKTWHDLNKPGIRVSATMGSTGAKFLAKVDKTTHLLVKDGSDSISQLLTDQADAWMAPIDTARTAQKLQPLLALVPGPSIASEEVAVALPRGDLALKAAVDGVFADLKKSGKLVEIIKKFDLDETSVA